MTKLNIDAISFYVTIPITGSIFIFTSVMILTYTSAEKRCGKRKTYKCQSSALHLSVKTGGIIMNSRQYSMFLTVAKAHSITKAAEELFISKQSLKSQIDTLEQSLGVTLLERDYSGCRLTPAGEIF